MRKTARWTVAVLLAATFAAGACGDDDLDAAARDAEEAAERVKDEAGKAKEQAEDGLATFRTGFERLVDEASSGDAEAQEKLLDDCRDSLEQLRQDNDPRAEQMGALCQKIRDADDGNAWKEIREEYDQITEADANG